MKAGYKQTEVGPLPSDWKVLSVGDMGEVITGKALAVTAPGRQRPYLRTKNVFDGRIDIDDVLV
jgi:type I restriction enzyme S subunit